jgi:hypothetical protein
MDELSDQLDQVLNAVTKQFPALTPTQISRAEGAAQAILLCYDSSVFEAAATTLESPKSATCSRSSLRPPSP